MTAEGSTERVGPPVTAGEREMLRAFLDYHRSTLAVFGFGETFLAPTASPLVNSLADDRARGRASALVGMAYLVAFVASPAICTGMIAAGLAAAWIGLLCGRCLGAVLLGLRLGRLLQPHQGRLQVARCPQPGPLFAEPAGGRAGR